MTGPWPNCVRHFHFSEWPQLESEIFKTKFIFWKLHNFELNVAYMNFEGGIWIKILFWVIWLLADINKISTREIKLRSQDLISYIIEVVIHMNILHIRICMTSQLSSLQGGFFIWIFHCVKMLWSHGMYILYILWYAYFPLTVKRTFGKISHSCVVPGSPDKVDSLFSPLYIFRFGLLGISSLINQFCKNLA